MHLIWHFNRLAIENNTGLNSGQVTGSSIPSNNRIFPKWSIVIGKILKKIVVKVKFYSTLFQSYFIVSIEDGIDNSAMTVRSAIGRGQWLLLTCDIQHLITGD